MADKIKIKTESGEIEVDREVIEAALKEADEPRVWKPKDGEKVFWLLGGGEIASGAWSDPQIDRDLYVRGRVFPTREAAEEDKRSGLDAYCVAYTTVKNWLLERDYLGGDVSIYWVSDEERLDSISSPFCVGFPFRIVSIEAAEELIAELPNGCKQLLWVKERLPNG